MKSMAPLDEMCQALVSINHLLKARKQSPNDIRLENRPVALSTDNSIELEASPIPPMGNNRLHSDPLTEENFHRAHLCSRSIDELPHISLRDIEHLKSIHIYTMQDLLGRFLIHDVSDHFQTFLVQTFQLSEPTASTITQLLERWTKYNLDVSRDRQSIDSMRE